MPKKVPFEEEVRNIARALWPSRPGAGAASLVDGRERDCIFAEEHVTHYLEITESRKLEKVRADAKKMVAYRDNAARKNRLVKLWIVTRLEPTADQRTYSVKNGVEILSLAEFRRRVLDAPQYLELRQNHSFGSAADPKTDSPNLSNVRYQHVAFRCEQSDETISIADIANYLQEGEHVVLLGDYGMGKSINVRELFLRLRAQYLKNTTHSAVPVVLNLREHWGQSNPAEALLRHAEQVGLDRPNQLVRAFNAGRLILLLDGFDEVGAMPWSRLNTKRLRNLRREATSLVRAFVEASRAKSGLIVAGREHFFDSKEELRESFGLKKDHITVRLSEFTDEEASAFLRSAGINQHLPAWFPRRPLLLASLAAQGFIEEVLSAAEDAEPAIAWDRLVDLVTLREAKIHKYLDSQGIRRILESLAAQTRETVSNLGPVSEDDLAEAFRREVGAYPDDTARPLLQRLPGLSMRNQQDGSRSFLDDQMLDVLRSRILFEFAENPWADPRATKWKHGIGALGAEVAAEKLRKASIPGSQVLVASGAANDRWKAPTLSMDLIQVLQRSDNEGSTLECEGIVLDEANCELLDLSDLPVPQGLTLVNSIVGELVLPNARLLRLSIRDCLIQQVIGANDLNALPPWIENSEVLAFDEALSNARIMQDKQQPVPVRVALTVLRKLYRQRGSGRRENAFYRGIDQKARKHVQKVLEILARESLTFSVKRRGYTVWHTVSGQSERANRIIDSSGRANDPALEMVRALI